ncbi:hypothetical protein T12_7707 [Trichinella patagoniensis]|uniref:Uncharacterized protein n=1 Tax=Trichinella patagoniensis TaxID=990121 RepID=A0A0V1AAT4_9BILA|nr:hypothetical protein T12_7707 [Trichinella patagoniensis]
MHSYYFITVLFDKRWRCATKVQVQDATTYIKYLSTFQLEDAYLTELLACKRIIITVQMLLRSRTLPGGYKS